MKKSAKKSAAKKPATKAAPKKTTSVAKKVAKKSSTPKAATSKKAPKGRAIPTRAEGAGSKKPTQKPAPKKVATKKPAPKQKSASAPVKSPAKLSPIKATVKKVAPKSRRPKSFAPRDVARAFGFPAEAPVIPEFYGEDRLVLMAKDPEYLFAYWEITPERQAEGEKAKLQGEEYREAMRLNWAARDLFDANYVLMPVTHAARKWYMRVPYSGIAYHVEIGWLGSQGHFISLLTSNPSDAPESWATTRRRLKETVAAGSVLARTLKAGRPQGSSENAPVHVEKLAVPVPGDWNFGGPDSLTSSFGKKPRIEKPVGGKRG
jgi:hypothetical protein